MVNHNPDSSLFYKLFPSNFSRVMNPFSQMINKYTLRFNHKINRFCTPILNNFGVNHFWYYKVTNGGHYTCLGSNLAWMEYYFGEKLYLPNPYLRNPKNFKSGTNFIKQLNDYSYQKSINIGVNINQSLVFLEKVRDGMEGYGFATYLPTNTFEPLCINEMPLLKLFVKKFREEFNPLLDKMSEELVDIASFIGPSFYKKDSSVQTSSIDRKLFLRQFHLSQILELSNREKEVLLLVSKGLFAVQIADHLRLSKRTIEHYIDNIKNKLNCFSKAELIQKANEFLSIGYSLIL